MNEREFVEYIRPLVKKDPELAHALDSEYTADPKASIEQLKARAEYSLGRASGRIAMADGKNVSGLANAFNVSEAMLRRIIDPNSKENWMTMPSSEIMKAAVRAGYMKELPNNATDAQKAENRQGLSDFLKFLSAETVSQGRRNAVNEYNNVKFSEHPVDWALSGLADSFLRTTSRRMKEQALRGQGPASWGQMDVKDWGALGGDAAVNAMYGAGAAGIGRALASRAPLGIRSARDILMAPAIAGALGGAGDALNRDINTENGARWYEYPSEAVIGAMSNVVAEPRVIRGALRGAAGVLKGGKVGGHSGREALGKGQQFADDLTGTTEAQLREIIEGLRTPNPASSPMTAETRKKIGKMGEILDDGMTMAPGEEASLFDKAQALYENGAYQADGRPRTAKIRDELFGTSIDMKIAELEGALKNNVGASDAPAVKRELEYWKNLKEMRANGIIDYDKYFFEKDPEPFAFTNTPKEGMPEFKLRDPGIESDRRDIGSILELWQKGTPVHEIQAFIEPERYSDLLSRYPELSNYLASDRKIMSTRPRTLQEAAAYMSKNPGLEVVGYYGNDNVLPVKYGKDFVPSAEVWKANFTQPKVARQTATEAALLGIGKPAATGVVMERYDRPEDSESSITREFEQLMARKPGATSAALNWKFDPGLDANDQLDEYERGIVNKYRAMLTEKALQGR